MSPLERKLGGAFQEAHSVAKSELGFGMPMLIRMAAEWGPTDAARRILPEVSDMYTKLFLHKRLDLSVEAIVLRAEFSPLFTDDELRLARGRLLESNYDRQGDEDATEVEAWAKLARKARDRWSLEEP